jgi:hypothetical protein
MAPRPDKIHRASNIHVFKISRINLRAFPSLIAKAERAETVVDTRGISFVTVENLLRCSIFKLT